MSTKFMIPSSDPVLLEKANKVAMEFIQRWIQPRSATPERKTSAGVW
jgi:hypothetical protein